MDLIASRVGAFWYDGKKVKPFEYDEAPTTMIQSYVSKVNSKSRIKKPCVRKNFLQNPDLPRSFNDEFVEIEWDEALDLVVKNLQHCYDKYGYKSIYAESYEWGGVGKIGWGRMLMHRLIRCIGGGVFELGDYSTGAGIVMTPYIFGKNVVYERPTDYKQILKHAKVVVFWGANPYVTNQISHDVPLHEHEKYLNQLANNKNIKTIFIDTHINKSAKKLNAKTILVHSNTDCAMMIGMCHYLYTNNLYSKDFIQNHTQGFDEFRDYFMGISDGVEKDILWASKICGVSEDELISLSLLIGKNPSILITGRAIQRQHNGELNYLALTTLACMCGYIGQDGLGLEFNLSSGCKGESAKNTKRLKNINELLGYVTDNAFYIPSSRLNECICNPNKDISYNLSQITYPDIKLMINACGSYFTHQPNSNQSLKALDKLKCIITLEPFWTSNAKFSDIVLPVAIEGERYDIEQSSNKEIIFALKPIKKPFFEAKSDFWICKQIAKRFDKVDEFCRNLDELELVKMAYCDLKNDYLKDNIQIPDFDIFMQKSFIKIQGLKELEPYTRFKNIPKINLSNQLLKPYISTFAKYEESSEMKSKYPLSLSSIHSEFRLHSQLDNTDIKDIQNDTEPAFINPKLAAIKNIKDGDIIMVFNDRGMILAGARVSNDVPYDCIVISQGAWWSPNDENICINGNVNVLTNSTPSSALSQSNIAHTCKVDIKFYAKSLKHTKTCFLPPKIIK